MLSLKSHEWFRVRGRGFVAMIERLPDEFYDDYYEPGQLVGKEVKINGEVFTVTGAEVYLIGGIGPDNPYKMSCGILVKEL